MPVEIAVFMGENGETASLFDKGKIVVYRKKLKMWSVLREMDFSLDNRPGMKELRGGMAVATGFLKGCRVFVGRSIAGVPYFELEKQGFSVWEFEGRPDEFLDYVLEKEEEDKQETNRCKKTFPPGPVETSGGCFYLSLKEIQEGSTGITSKQALVPFLKKGEFYSLEVLCSHVPPWLEAEIATGSLNGVIQKNSHSDFKIIITKRCCCHK